MSWLSLLPDLSDSVDVIGKLAENVKKAVEVGKSIYGEAQRGRLKNSLAAIRTSMMNTNSKKIKSIYDLTDYLDDNVFKMSWSEIIKDWQIIADNLDKMLKQLEQDDASYVEGAGFANGGELKAALSRQAQIYRKLTAMAEPQDEEERKKAREIDEQLKLLFGKVVSLEEAIDRYLRKFAPDLAGP